MKNSNETLQNLPYFIFIYMKTQNRFFIDATYARAFIMEKNKVAQNEKKLCGFHIPKVWQILKRFAGTCHQA